MTELEKRLTDALSELSEQYERERDEKTGVPLRQRIDSVDRLEFAGVCPGCSQFILVQSRPLCDKAQRLRGKPTCESGKCFDTDESLHAGILRVKMRWCVVGKVHLDDDPVESTQFRHRQARASTWGRSLPRACPSIEDTGHRGTGRCHQARRSRHSR